MILYRLRVFNQDCKIINDYLLVSNEKQQILKLNV